MTTFITWSCAFILGYIALQILFYVGVIVYIILEGLYYKVTGKTKPVTVTEPSFKERSEKMHLEFEESCKKSDLEFEKKCRKMDLDFEENCKKNRERYNF
jgi:hypothetical protein